MKLTLYLLLGSAFILVAFLALAKVSGAGFNYLEISKHSFDPSFQILIFLLLYIGFGSIAAVFPLHTWSPDGYAAAPTAGSMLHAGVLKKLGAYGIIRIAVLLLPEGARYWSSLMAALAIANILYGAYCALHQKDLKYMIGYLCISHMGVVLLGIATGTTSGLNGAIFQMVAHGLMTALFFSATGFIYDRTHTRMIPDLGGLAKQMPLATTFLVLGGLASIGLPGTAIFNAELMVFMASMKLYPVFTVLGISTIVLTAFYVLRSLQYSVFGPVRITGASFKDATLFLSLPRVLLIFALLVFGFFPNLLLNIMRATTTQLFGGF
jgi:NADH-quinone oxidoreductase subunit M